VHQYIESSVDKHILPDWLERPGAPEAIASQLLEQVDTYELEYKKFSDWLGEEKAVRQY